LKLAIQEGMHDENKLTNLIFFARHPALPANKPLDRKHQKYKELTAEWSRIRKNEVLKAIQYSAPTTDIFLHVYFKKIDPRTNYTVEKFFDWVVRPLDASGANRF
jgi:hypothetical protein